MRARLLCGSFARALTWITFALCAAACSDSIEVLAPSTRAIHSADSGAFAADAHVPAGDASGAHGNGGANATQRDASAPSSPGATGTSTACPACGTEQLCAIDHCIDASAVTSLGLWFGHTCEVDRGQLFCFGANPSGQLGVGDLQTRDRRTRVGTFNDWLSVSAGEQETCAIRAPGQLYCWGDNSAGQLGQGDMEARLTPTQVGDAADWLAVACGGKGCCGLLSGGALSCWGDNLEGKIGQDDAYGAPDVNVPTVVSAGTKWRAVAVGQGHVCAIRDSGALYCWGRNPNFELGLGSADPVQLRVPTRVGDASDWRAIAASMQHSCGVREDGSLWCWGVNSFFATGAPVDVMHAEAPRRVDDATDWADVGVGWFHSCGIKRDGRLLCWGRSIEGQLGQGQHDDPVQTPGEVKMPERWQRIALGNFYTCGIDRSGTLYCFGKADEGALGTGDSMRRYVPNAVP